MALPSHGEGYPLWVILSFWASLAMFVATVVATPIVVGRLPPDYFAHQRRHPLHPQGRGSALQRVGTAAKNVVGALLVLAGLLMLLGPGQGGLTILIGMMLANYPGKYRLERWFAGRPPIWRALTWLRRKAGATPLQTPVRHHGRGEADADDSGAAA